MTDLVPIDPLDAKEDKLKCDDCGTKSKYMFHIMEKNWELGDYEIEGVYCYKCACEAYMRQFPSAKKGDAM